VRKLLFLLLFLCNIALGASYDVAPGLVRLSIYDVPCGPKVTALLRAAGASPAGIARFKGGALTTSDREIEACFLLTGDGQLGVVTEDGDFMVVPLDTLKSL
jgi:hypothetical protein